MIYLLPLSDQSRTDLLIYFVRNKHKFAGVVEHNLLIINQIINIMRVCTCPVGTYMTNIGALTCPESFGQIQKLLFQRAAQAAGFGTLTSCALLQTWTTLLTATNSTKVVVTPFIAGFTPETGKAREFGSGNEVRNGIPIIFGTNPTKVTCKLYEPTSAVVANLKALECESVVVGFVNELGYYGFEAQTVATGVPSTEPVSADELHGFTVQSFHVSDRILGGFDGPDYVEISFSLPANWSTGFHILKPTDHSGLDHSA